MRNIKYNSIQSICQLKTISMNSVKMSKFEQWVQHNLTNSRLQSRHMFDFTTEPFLQWIVANDERRRKRERERERNNKTHRSFMILFSQWEWLHLKEKSVLLPLTGLLRMQYSVFGRTSELNYNETIKSERDCGQL